MKLAFYHNYYLPGCYKKVVGSQFKIIVYHKFHEENL